MARTADNTSPGASPTKTIASLMTLVVAMAGLTACSSGADDASSRRPDPSLTAPPGTPTPSVSATGNTAASGGMTKSAKILFLHHSTGGVIWNGGVPAWVRDYNARRGTRYQMTEQAFPKEAPYGWNNYPYDYWNIWVRHAGPEPFQDEPTLEMLTKQYQVIVWKHCFPVSAVAPDTGTPDVASDDKRLENYKLQYLALRQKMRSFPGTRFVVWTSAALVRSATSEAEAKRSQAFVTWVRNTWDEPGDNVFVWDFWRLETAGGRYLAPGNSSGGDSHPSTGFARRVAPGFAQRVIDVIEGRGDG